MTFFKQSGNDKKNNNKIPLKIITLGGTEAVTKNLTLYECGEDIIAVDCGIGFPDSEMLGVDIVIPDMTYLVENSHKIKGLFLTHGHEDHIGAVPYFLEQFPQVPIYASKLVQGFLREKLGEKRYINKLKNTKFHLLTADTDEVSVGCFKISGFRVNHSVPASTGFAIKTPQGLILHISDFKIDWTPVLDKPIDLATIARYGEEGVLCLLSDCLGITEEGYSKSESSLNNTFDEFFENAPNRQILVTTISSNISRMYQIISSAMKHGRRVVLSGRSIGQSVRVARSLGYLPFDDDLFVDERDCQKHLQKDLVYIIAGCYGQEGSSLGRLGREEHEDIILDDNALVVFSADPNPPGVLEAVERLMDRLTLAGAEVVYSKIQDNLHVSGHGTKGDLTLVAALAKPKYFIPIGGTVTRMRAYTYMVSELGFDPSSVFEQLAGEVVEFLSGNARRGEAIEVHDVFVDGSSVGEVGPAVIREREQLSDDGIFVVIVPISKDKKALTGKIEIVTSGFVYIKGSKALIGKSRDIVNKVLDKDQGRIDNWNSMKRKIEDRVEKFLFKETRRRPLLLVQRVNC
jgi:ribonuclease J